MRRRSRSLRRPLRSYERCLRAHFRSEAVKVLPGEYYVADEDLLIMTTLGSCIAACLWDRERRVGGMNHFMLPEGSGDSGRYGSFAMDLLIGELVNLGAEAAGEANLTPAPFPPANGGGRH